VDRGVTGDRVTVDLEGSLEASTWKPELNCGHHDVAEPLFKATVMGGVVREALDVRNDMVAESSVGLDSRTKCVPEDGEVLTCVV